MNKTLIAAAIATVLVSATAGAAQHKSGHAKTLVAHRAGVPVHTTTPSGVFNVLYDQFVNATTNGIFVDDSTSSSDSYDSEGADDFIVPAGGWTVQQFNFQGFAVDDSTNPGTSLNDWPATTDVFVYPDASGTPGDTPVCSYPGAADTYDAQTGIVSVALPTACVLPAGKFWVGMQAVADFPLNSEEFHWVGSSPVANSGAVFENPGDALPGLPPGCTSFTAVPACFDGADPDLAFQVLGNPTTPVRLQDFGVD